MESIVKEKRISFKELEKKIFNCACMASGEITAALLEEYDGELEETIGRLSGGEVSARVLEERAEILSAAKAPKKEGKGERYAELIRGHMPLLEAARTAARDAFVQAFCQ